MNTDRNWVSACRKLAETVRAECLRMTHRGESGHVGSMLSMAELLSVLYLRVLDVDPKNPDRPDRDRFVLSKGHGGCAVYAALGEMGFFPKDWYQGYYRDAGKLMGHISHYVPGVEFSTGSLGHGLPVAVGMALAAKVRQKKHRIVCLMSDGDINEGSTWEAIWFAAQHHLDNLTVVLDYNRVQALGRSREVLDMEPLDAKVAASHWSYAAVDGHDIEAIDAALATLPFEKDKPSWLTAHTVKGNANVKIVIIGGGLAYGPLGISHQATEDIAIMRALPNMAVFCPCDFAEAEAGVHAMIEYDGPLYYRCGYKQEPDIHAGTFDFQLGKAIQVRDGEDLAFLFTGTIGNQVVPAADELARRGINARVISMHTVKPIDEQVIVDAARETGGLVIVEEHQILGGLGGAVAEVLARHCAAAKRFLHLALPDLYISKVGTHEWLLDQYGLSTPRIVDAVIQGGLAGD